MKPKKQDSKYQSPWPLWTQLILIAWRLIWLFTCSWTPKFMNPWRLFILKVFGATILGIPFVHSTVKIQIPWHLTMKHRACLGDKSNAYSLAEIEIHEDATVAQEVYLCTGTHDFKSPTYQLMAKKIIIKKNAFIGARSMILPGIKVEENAVVGAMSVVTKNVTKDYIVAGNPARKIGIRNGNKIGN